MKRLALPAATFLWPAASAAFGQDVRYDYATGLDCCHCKTGKWVLIPAFNHR